MYISLRARTTDAMVEYTTVVTFPNVTDVANDTRRHVYVATLQHNALDVISGFALAVIVFLTLFGNSLVIRAVVGFPRLRTTTNMFIVSLAVADITVALLVMPFSIVDNVALQHWIFGWVFCYFWISCDVMCCTASILHLCVISLDRYIAIQRPLKYKKIMSRTRAALLIVAVWLCSGFISFVPIYLGWFADSDVTLYKSSPRCGLFVNKIYAVISSMTSFYVPLVVMTYAYYKIFRIARAQAIDIKRLQISARGANQRPDDGFQGKLRRVARNTKAVKTLGTLMGLFIISWLPFFLMYLILPFCDACVLAPRVESFITWLGYVNSLINPCVYALLNKDFRRAFRRILKCSSRAHSGAYLQSHGGTPSMTRFRMTHLRKTTLKQESTESIISSGGTPKKTTDDTRVRAADTLVANGGQKRELNGNSTSYTAAVYAKVSAV